ncbi:MAG: PAS domain S-box protein, partial [Thiobacillus sp.]|nr:PAS domain S-box protein [Thiobacillus sp.]
MRNNMPVTQVEYVLKDGEALTSKTDIHGNITFVNQDFVNISGFSEAELLGAPQNIVRHPDMPAEAFADFWRT